MKRLFWSRCAGLTAGLLLTSTIHPLKKFHAAEPSVGPRLAQALELAAQERRQAETRLVVAGSSVTARAPAQLALSRARAWEAALADAAAAARPQDADFVVSAAKGVAQLLRGGETAPLKRGTLLRETDQLVTLEGRAELRFHDGSLLALGPASALRVLQAPRGFPQQSVFTLERGALYWEGPAGVAGLARVMTPRASAQLRAGRAELSVDPDGTARLAVRDGSVELSARPDPFASASGGWWDEVHK